MLDNFLFYYQKKLHYSQTCFDPEKKVFLFYYQKKLHYSQTRRGNKPYTLRVLLPKEITLLSNSDLQKL